MTPGAQAIWVSELGKLSANRRVTPNAYPDELTRKMAQPLVEAEVFRFDGSDLMPAAVGAGTFWTGIVSWVQANGANTSEVVDTIDASWPK